MQKGYSMERKRMVSAVAVLVLCTVNGLARADGFLVPRPPRIPIAQSYDVTYHRVKIAVRDQVANVRIDQAFRNTGRGSLEVTYVFPIPVGASLSGFAMVVDGKRIEGQVLSAEEARRIYQDIVRRKRDPALLEYVGQGMFRTRVFPIPPGRAREVVMTYTQVLKKDNSLVELLYPLSTEKYSHHKLRECTIDVSIQSGQAIKAVYCPTHEVRITRMGDHQATCSYAARNVKPDRDFQLFYHLSPESVGASVVAYKPSLGQPGFFLLLASASVQLGREDIQPKNVILVLDRSGSMSDNRKIDQAKAALRFVLNSLNPKDRFGLVSYNSSVDVFQPRLVDYTPHTRDAALDYVSKLTAAGGTNILDALVGALGMVERGGRPNIVVFLTDGLPTVGERDPDKIVRAVAKANRGSAHGERVPGEAAARIFTFGVGYDVNTKLLGKVADDNRGYAEYVRPNESIEVKVSSLYAKIQNPVLTDLGLTFPGVRVFDVYPRRLPDLFQGSQLVVLGRYESGGRVPVCLSGRRRGRSWKFVYELDLPRMTERTELAFVARLWASQKIGYLLDQIRLHGRSDEVVKEIVNLATDYGIVTEYTSFLVREDVNQADRRGLAIRAASEARARMAPAAGKSAVAQAMNIGRLRKQQTVAGLKGYTDAEGRRQELRGLRHVGARTFYLKSGVWVQSDVDVAREQMIDVVQFSPTYFKLVEALGRDNQYLAFANRIVVRLRGQVYRILAAK